MPATVLVAPDERPAMGFILARACDFFQHGTAEQQDSASSLAEMLSGLEEAPPGALEMDFLTQDAYLLGVRIVAVAQELEDYWLDARAGARPLVADAGFEAALRRFFPQVAEDSQAWKFDQVDGVFIGLGFKVDRALTAAAPRVRGMYNHDRERAAAMTAAMHEQRAKARAEGPDAGSGAVLVGTKPVQEPVAPPGWGVDLQTGLSPDEIPADSFRPLTVGSVTILITNYAGRLAAIGGVCSHQAASLVKGRIDGALITCPRHGAEYDLRSGQEICPPFCQRWMDEHGMIAKIMRAAIPEKTGGNLPVYPLRVENNEIILHI